MLAWLSKASTALLGRFARKFFGGERGRQGDWNLPGEVDGLLSRSVLSRAESTGLIGFAAAAAIAMRLLPAGLMPGLLLRALALPLVIRLAAADMWLDVLGAVTGRRGEMMRLRSASKLSSMNTDHNVSRASSA